MAGREMLGAVFVVLVGCSSETTVVVPNCGPGTVAKDGVCVPEVVDGSADTTPSSDTGTTADTSVDAASDTADSPGEAATDVATDALGDGEVAVDATGGDDPCPTSLDYNCSDTCGPIKCASGGCAYYPWPKIAASPKTKVTIRTPSKPPDSICIDGTCRHRFMFPIDYDWPSIRVRVGAGWKIGAATGTASVCLIPSSVKEGCFYTKLYHPVVVYTDDPLAPARNIELDIPDVDAGPPCP